MTNLLITTSRKPSQRTRSFVKDLASSLPATVKLNRGKKTLVDLSLDCYKYRAKYLFIINERKGNPSVIRIYSLENTDHYPFLKQIALLKLSSVKLSREIHSSRVYSPEYVRVNYDNCLTNSCFYIADLLIDIYRDRVRDEKYDVSVDLEEISSEVEFKIRNQLGKICGPIVRFNGVKII